MLIDCPDSAETIFMTECPNSLPYVFTTIACSDSNSFVAITGDLCAQPTDLEITYSNISKNKITILVPAFTNQEENDVLYRRLEYKPFTKNIPDFNEWIVHTTYVKEQPFIIVNNLDEEKAYLFRWVNICSIT